MLHYRKRLLWMAAAAILASVLWVLNVEITRTQRATHSIQLPLAASQPAQSLEGVNHPPRISHLPLKLWQLPVQTKRGHPNWSAVAVVAWVGDEL